MDPDQFDTAPTPAPPTMGPSSGPVACYRHPGRPTRLSCSSCGKPICVDCTNQAAVGQKCPECAAPSGRSRVIRARDVQPSSMLDGAPVTKAILGVSVGIAVLGLLAPALWNQLAILLADDVRSVADGELWRVLTGAVLHDRGFLFHIAFNMWALAVFGPQIERRAGAVPFALLYLASAAAGGAMFQAFREVGTAVGASGAIFGLFGVHVASAFLARNTVAGRASLRQLGPLLAINLALPLFVPNIAWEAHVGGLIAGALIVVAWSRVAPLGRVVAANGGGMSPVVSRSLIAGVVLLACMVALPFL